ncbi:MAG: metallophosphoesterase family protein [Polyangiaceae bacterium]
MRIAHISDLHVLALTGVPRHRFLNKRLTGYANLRFKRNHVHKSSYVESIAKEIARSKIDHVVVTGDLTNLALETEFEAARDLLERGLGLSPKDVSVVPGNHDLYTAGALKSRRFTQFFAEYIQSDLPELAAKTRLGPFPFVRLRGPCAIIGLTTAVPRPPFVASGTIGKAQLDAFAKILSHEEVRKRTPVVLLHHPLHNPPSKLKTLLEGLTDADELAEHLRSAVAADGLVLHGHLHRRQTKALSHDRKGIHVVGATSASLHHEHRDRMAGFNVYDIAEDGRVELCDARVFDAEKETFQPAAIPVLG